MNDLVARLRWAEGASKLAWQDFHGSDDYPQEVLILKEAADALERKSWQPWPPPKGTGYVLAWHYGTLIRAYQDTDRWFDAGDDENLTSHPPTHWQPMPNAPEQESSHRASVRKALIADGLDVVNCSVCGYPTIAEDELCMGCKGTTLMEGDARQRRQIAHLRTALGNIVSHLEFVGGAMAKFSGTRRIAQDALDRTESQ